MDVVCKITKTKTNQENKVSSWL